MVWPILDQSIFVVLFVVVVVVVRVVFVVVVVVRVGGVVGLDHTAPSAGLPSAGKPKISLFFPLPPPFRSFFLSHRVSSR